MGELIGFVGVGKMGLPLALRLIEAGYRIVAHDANSQALAPLEAKGAKRATSAAAVADVAETIFVSLPTPEIVEDVVLGASGIVHGSKHCTVVDLSTTGPRTSSRIAEQLAIANKAFVDAPVSGGVAGALAGTLAVMVAGSVEDVGRITPILRVFGQVFHVGSRPGQGQAMKLVNNLLSGAALAVSSEALVLGVKAGLDPTVMCKVINAGSGRNSATQDKFPKSIIPRTFNHGFATNLMLKDVQLFMREAEAFGLSLTTAAAVCNLWKRAAEEVGDHEDFTTIAKVVERDANVEVGAAQAEVCSDFRLPGTVQTRV